MDYLIIFEDGTEALAHYGTKGMKWGVWNAETRERYADSSGRNTSFQTDMEQRAHVNDDGYITLGRQTSAAEQIRKEREAAVYAERAKKHEEERLAREASSPTPPSKRLSDLSWDDQVSLTTRTEPRKKTTSSPLEAQMKMAMQMHMSDTSSAQLAGGNAILSDLLKNW